MIDLMVAVGLISGLLLLAGLIGDAVEKYLVKRRGRV